MKKEFKKFTLIKVQEMAMQKMSTEDILKELMTIKNIQSSIDYLAERILYCWGFPEFDSAKLNKERAKKSLINSGYQEIIKALKAGKISKEKLDSANEIRQQKGESIQQSQTLNTYMYKYAKGGMRFALIEEMKNQFPDTTAYAFEHLIRSHKGEQKIEMPISFCYVEEVIAAINNSGAKQQVSAKQVECFLNRFSFTQNNYTPVYKDINNNPDLIRLKNNTEKKIFTILNTSYSDDVKAIKLAAIKLDYEAAYEEINDLNNKAKKQLIEIIETFLSVRKMTYRQQEVDRRVAKRLNALKNM